MKKKITQKIINKTDISIVLIVILSLIILQKFNFFKNVYLITKKNLDDRQINISYDFCSNNASGYVFYIKNKFNLKKRPLIINYGIEPKQDWIFKKNNIIDLSEKIILLNYSNNIIYNFKKDKNFDYWISYDMATPNTTNGAKSIEFIGNYKKTDNIQKVSFYKREIAVISDVENIKFNLSKNLNNYYKMGEINFKFNDQTDKHLLNRNNINFDDHDSLKFLTLDKSFDDTEIRKIKLYLNNKIDLSEYLILDNFKNKCLFISKND